MYVSAIQFKFQRTLGCEIWLDPDLYILEGKYYWMTILALRLNICMNLRNIHDQLLFLLTFSRPTDYHNWKYLYFENWREKYLKYESIIEELLIYIV